MQFLIRSPCMFSSRLFRSITSILVSRFILNLREAAEGDSPDNDADPSFVRHSHIEGTTRTGTLHFADFVDSMGVDLDHGIAARSVSDSSDWSDGPLQESELDSLAATQTYHESRTLKSAETGLPMLQ